LYSSTQLSRIASHLRGVFTANFATMAHLNAGHIAIILIVGFVAGILGGLLGIGGSVIMIPSLSILMQGNEHVDQHLIQASAMVVNVAVAIPSAMRHYKAGAVRMEVVRWMLPIGLLAILLGVLLSDQFSASVLKQIFAVFLFYVTGINAWKLLRKSDSKPVEKRAQEKTNRFGIVIVGTIMGGSAGLLGIGGGVITVPAMQLILKMPLRNCIATTATVMCVTAPIGAAMKLVNLSSVHHRSPGLALFIAVLLIPTAIFGARLGARLTHTLPLVLVRLVFTILLLVAALRMSGLLG